MERPLIDLAYPVGKIAPTTMRTAALRCSIPCVAYSPPRLRRKSGAPAAGSGSFSWSWGQASARGVLCTRCRACCLRRLRFSRSAAANRASRAARAPALPPLAGSPVLLLDAMIEPKACPRPARNATEKDPRACAAMPAMASHRRNSSSLFAASAALLLAHGPLP